MPVSFISSSIDPFGLVSPGLSLSLSLSLSLVLSFFLFASVWLLREQVEKPEEMF
jgi:hypothetical protein